MMMILLIVMILMIMLMMMMTMMMMLLLLLLHHLLVHLNLILIIRSSSISIIMIGSIISITGIIRAVSHHQHCAISLMLMLVLVRGAMYWQRACRKSVSKAPKKGKRRLTAEAADMVLVLRHLTEVNLTLSPR